MGDVRKNIPLIYAALDNRHIDQYTSIIEMDGNICDQVVSILIGPRSNYIYVNHDLVDKCC